jgi:hypothetical protein
MPKPKHVIDPYCIQRLKKEIQLFVGIQVNNRPSCIALSEELKVHYGLSISASTISRLFLNDTENHHFYLDTLDKFCDLVQKGINWNQYCESVLTQKDQALSIGIHHEIDFRNSLLYINFEFSGWRVLRNYFERLQPYFNDSNYQHLSFDLGGALHRIAQSNKSFEKSIYKNFVGFESVRKSYFELLADPEFKLPFYKDGLNLYGQTINYSHPNASNDLCFYLSMLCLNSDKNNELDSFIEHYARLVDNFNLLTVVDSNIHPYNIGRFLAVLLIHKYRFQKELFDTCFADVILFLKSNLSIWTSYEKRLIMYFLVFGLSRSNAPYKFFKVVETTLGFHFLDGKDLNDSITRFLYSKEPNTISWYRRWGTL